MRMTTVYMEHAFNQEYITKACLFWQIYWKCHIQKLKKNQIRNVDIFLISAQNIDCGYSLKQPWQGGSNEYPQSMFFSKNKNNVYPCKHQFYCIKQGLRGSKFYRHVFVMIRCHRMAYCDIFIIGVHIASTINTCYISYARQVEPNIG